MADKRRFRISTKENSKIGMVGTRIITDKHTGVQYIFAFDGYAGGMTLLVDKDGKPLLAQHDHD